MNGGRKKRFWSEEEKRSICEQTLTPGVSVAQVGRRYALNANMIFKWLKDPRFAPQVVDVEPVPAFLPVEISEAAVGAPSSPTSPPPPSALPCAGGRVSLGKIEIELSGGHRITAAGDVDVDLGSLGSFELRDGFVEAHAGGRLALDGRDDVASADPKTPCRGAFNR